MRIPRPFPARRHVILIDMTLDPSHSPRVTGPVYPRLGRALRAARDARGLTQAEAASRAGLKRTTLTNIEKGEQTVAVHQLLDIAAALGEDPGTLLARAAAEPDADARADDVGSADLRAWVASLTARDSAPGRS
jgi:transcriptional regulator with XRE-family HTH domain